ncbi:MAG: MBL fold metallo-hydrolase, partial [Deltaproteobacteria bacterium]|nr:MBL fold metallo-hydrolase [Deltaproteobacteria bacterium]
MADLQIYVLNVGQADTAILVTPGGKFVLIDAVRPAKTLALLKAINGGSYPRLDCLVVTHPHQDHYSGVAGVLAQVDLDTAILPPFWYDEGTPGYHQAVNAITTEPGTQVRFLAGYERLYPDSQGYPGADPCYLELLGPPNDLLTELVDDKKFNMNHLSIIARLNLGKFRMVFAADAQMENWSHYDSERMLRDNCTVLKAAHHGSKNGTQWERLERLEPRYVLVSSDPDGRDELPDLVGCSVFHTYQRRGDAPCVALTRTCGSVRISVSAKGQLKGVDSFGEDVNEVPDLANGRPV